MHEKWSSIVVAVVVFVAFHFVAVAVAVIVYTHEIDKHFGKCFIAVVFEQYTVN